MKTFQDRQSPIDAAIANALVEATPEHWHAALMVAEQRDGRVRLEITSPERHPDRIGATNELAEQVFKLIDLFKEAGTVWSRATYEVTQAPDSSWSYRAIFEY